jgi:hypothetical protein
MKKNENTIFLFQVLHAIDHNAKVSDHSGSGSFANLGSGGGKSDPEVSYLCLGR